MNEIILNVSSRDNLEILLMIEISSRDLLNHPSWPGCPASFLQSYFSRRRSTSSPPRSSQAHSQSSSRLERYREMRRMRDDSENNLKWKEKWEKTCLKAHLTVEPFALAGALGGTSESPFEQHEEPKRFHWKDLTFAGLWSQAVVHFWIVAHFSFFAWNSFPRVLSWQQSNTFLADFEEAHHNKKTTKHLSGTFWAGRRPRWWRGWSARAPYPSDASTWGLG